MRALPRPIVASLNGTVAGAGAALALASDFRLAADTAKIAFLFVKGLVTETKGRSLEEIETDLQQATHRKERREPAGSRRSAAMH